MLYYELPNLKHIFNPSTFVLKYSHQIAQSTYINQSLHNYLEDAKRDIHNNIEEWDIMKKYTNPYEFIHTGYEKSFNKGVSLKKPLSRAYYKMIEMLHFFDIFEKCKYIPIRSFHLAEGPGGFIEAVADFRKCKEDKYVGMSLENGIDQNIPGWKKSKRFLDANPNVTIERGPNNNGDLYEVENYKYIIENYSGTQHLVTADGGFDFSHNYNSQECVMVRLILTQIIYAISMQAKGGTFILKIFDILHKSTCDTLYLLEMFYDSVIICKPQTSRIANSEKYAVCKGFKYANVALLHDMFTNVIMSMKTHFTSEKIWLSQIFDINLPIALQNKLVELNAVFGQQQIENIKYTIQLINDKDHKYERVSTSKKNNIQKALDWCARYKVQCIEQKRTNIFKPSSES